MTKKQIIEEYLAIEGNSEKSMRVSIAEIEKRYGVKISVGMFHKTKVNSEHQSEHPEVNSEHQSEQSKVNSEHQSEHPEVNSEQSSEHPEVNSEQSSEQSKVNSEHQSEQSKVNSEHRMGELTPELEMVLNRMGECTNLFDMAEVVRQLDVYVQMNNVSVKHLVNKKLDSLLDWQLKLVADYGLDERLCFTF